MHAIVLMLAVVWCSVVTRLHITCLWQWVWGITCPTCGMTRALLSLVRWDIDGYIRYNGVALPALAAVWYMMHQKLVKSHRLRRGLYGVSIGILLLNWLYYLLRF